MGDESPSESNDRNRPKSILRFAGMGVQLAVAIGLGVMAGLQLDEWLGWAQPIGTACCALLGLSAGMYQVLKALA